MLSPNRKKSEGVGDGTALPLHPDREPSDWSSHRDGGDHSGQFTLWRNWDHVSPPQKYLVHNTSLYSDVNLSNGMEIFPWTLLGYEKWSFLLIVCFLFGVAVPLWKGRAKRSVWMLKLHGSRMLLRGWCQGKPRSLSPKGNQTLCFIGPELRLNYQHKWRFTCRSWIV